MGYNWEWKRVSDEKPHGRVLPGNDALQVVTEGEWFADREAWSVVDWEPTHWQAMPTPPQAERPPVFLISDGQGGR